MSQSIVSRIGALGLAALAALSLAAAATPSQAASTTVWASAKSPLNVRIGPGVQYERIDTLYQNETVQVTQCASNNWCYVTHSGPDGWVSASYLTFGAAVQPTPQPQPITPAPQPTVPAPHTITTGNGITITIGGTFGTPSHILPRVCVYSGAGYTGSEFCASPGGNYRTLGNWNDKISSVRVEAGADVTLCTGINYSGFCRTLTHSEAQLGGTLNNNVSSFHTH
ncbi:MAG: SH3 domain-containing protein [Hyphomicrobiaceae bacterium]|nr:SH3 domain-containing protein [Hyphomicrobiaceae bacterium]MCC0023251.1 SH3 domain-containing protein [Hyphomicrobiaceae bacterium]